MRRDGFVLQQARGIPVYSCRAFEELGGLCHGFSTRRGGALSLSECSMNLGYTAWDTPARVDQNRRRFLDAIRLDEARLVTLHQVHSNRVYIIRDNSGQWNQPEADALITCLEGVVLAVQTADCLPVLIADPVTGAIAAVHAGWRGTLAHILPGTVRQMETNFGVDPANLLAAVGPGIRSCCYEVGPEMAEFFDDEFPGASLAAPAQAPGKYLLDLCRALEADAHRAGMRPENFYDSCLCTRCRSDEFFSYRGEGDRAGRMMAVIGRIPLKRIREAQAKPAMPS